MQKSRNRPTEGRILRTKHSGEEKMRYMLIMASSLGLVAACGSQQDEAEMEYDAIPAEDAAAITTSAPDACSVLPATEVTAVIGEPARDSLALAMPSTGEALTLSQCNYSTATNAAAASLMLRKAASGETPDGMTAGARQSIIESGVATEDVQGLGTISFWGGNQLHVATADWYVVVTPTPAGGLTQARSLAERTMTRLP
jgi:hypothetical protein